MLEVAVDLRAEADELHAFLETLSEEDWGRATPFLGWTVWDVVAHLHHFDRFSIWAATDLDTFRQKRDEMLKRRAAGTPGAELTREELGHLSPRQLLAEWIRTCHALCRELGGSDPKRRLPWFGPDMGVRMFTTARLMETWAHGQDVHDLLRVPRTPTGRLRHVAEIGVRTFGWTFAVRGQQPPGPPPHVRLVAPSGAVWEWGEPDGQSRVSGSALDFCRVVTQNRNVADTSLEVVGDVARKWMAIAQCFAGGAADPPKPGERAWNEEASA